MTSTPPTTDSHTRAKQPNHNMSHEKLEHQQDRQHFAYQQAAILDPWQTMHPQKQARRRLLAELKAITNDPPEGFSLTPVNEDLFTWTAIFIGPSETPYEGGLFHLKIDVPDSYPQSPPEVEFTHRVYHPNIAFDGSYICLSILGEEWCPALTLERTVLSIQVFMGSPDVEDPLVAEVAEEYVIDRVGFERTAREWTEKYAGREGADAWEEEEEEWEVVEKQQAEHDESCLNEEELALGMGKSKMESRRKLVSACLCRACGG